MSKRQKQEPVGECLQCQGDEMLEVRKHATELFSAMDLITNAFGAGASRIGSVPEIVQKLLDRDKSLSELVGKVAELEAQQLRDADDLHEIARFLAGVCKDDSGAVHVGGRSLTIDAARCFTRIADKAERCLAKSVAVRRFAQSIPIVKAN